MQTLFNTEIHATRDPFLDIMPELLVALSWKGDARRIVEALPPERTSSMDVNDFRDAMARLGFASQLRVAEVEQMDADYFPAIFIENDGQPILLKNEEDRAAFGARSGQVLVFEPASMPLYKNGERISWARELRRFAPSISHAVFISFLIGALALVPTFYNMAIYDQIIGSGSAKPLTMLFAGAAMALAAEVIFRGLRNKYLAAFGARLDHYISTAVFERLLFLPSGFTERSSVSAQIARLRDFESVREFFTGPLASLFFELPLMLIYVVAMVCIAWSLALVPVVLVVAYAGLLWAMAARMKENAATAATTASQRQEFVLETVAKLRAIRLSGMENTWAERYQKVSANASEASFRSAFSAQTLETMSYVLMTLGAVATLSLGVTEVINEKITVGTLVASMMLVWRVVSPMQVACASMTRLQQLFASTKQIQRLLEMPPERNPYATTGNLPEIKGQVSFHRVSLRYTPESEPALLGVTFDIKPGQVIAIKGANGSGKSTILKMILGLHTPQGGSVRLDGVDLRQYDPSVLRQIIAYAPQHVDFFPGTIRDNLLLANPVATDQDCWRAVRLACAEEEVKSLAQQLDTVISGENADNISFMLRQRLNLARAYVKVAPIMLFDEASHSLGRENDDAFPKLIQHFRNRTTVIMVTHREDHMRLADQLLVLEKGELVQMGKPEPIITGLRGRVS